MRFLSFGSKIFGLLVKFCMEMMILMIFANGSIFEDFGSSGALNEIFEFREQDFWIPRQILYGNDDFEDFEIGHLEFGILTNRMTGDVTHNPKLGC